MSAGGRRAWRVLRLALAIGFLVAVTWLLVRHVRAIEWSGLAATLRDYDTETLLLAVCLAAFSYLLYGLYDVLARRVERHAVTPGRTWAIGATSYAFNLNLGTLVGGLGIRLRLYSRHGLRAGEAARLIALGVGTNWGGYLLLAGTLFASGWLEVPDDWAVASVTLRVAGVAMLACVAALLALCARAGGRTIAVRGRVLRLPTLRIALLQLAVATANWTTIGTLIWLLLGGQVAWPLVVAVTLSAAVAGVASHVPAGLGVLEAVFVVLIGDLVAPTELVAALLAYRAIYYLAPLAVAVLGWGWLERRVPALSRP